MIKFFLLAVFAVGCTSGLLDPIESGKCRPVKNTMLTCLDSTAGDLPKFVNNEIEWLIFTRSNVPVLKKEHMSNFPSLTDLHLKETNLERIEDDAFASTKNLAWVDVSLNKLTRIHPNLFRACPNAYYFNVSGNPDLIVPENEPFLVAPQLKWLLVQNCRIRKLFSETFGKLNGLKFLSLSDNELETIPSDLFKPLKHLNSLDLSRNHFKSISIDMPNFRTLALYMGDNPWECDCSLFPTIEWAKRHRIKDDVKCAKPENKNWQEITRMDCPKVSGKN